MMKIHYIMQMTSEIGSTKYFQVDITLKNIKFIQFLTPYPRIYSNWIIDLNIKNGDIQVCVK